MPEIDSPLPKARKPPPIPRPLTPSPDIYPIRIKRAGSNSVTLSSPPQVAPSPDARRRIKRSLFMSSRFLNLQANEVAKDGTVLSGSSNSEEEDDQNLSCVSQTADHSNAEHHVYLQGMSSQGGFPAPMHEARFVDSDRVTLAGMVRTKK